MMTMKARKATLVRKASKRNIEYNKRFGYALRLRYYYDTGLLPMKECINLLDRQKLKPQDHDIALAILEGRSPDTESSNGS